MKCAPGFPDLPQDWREKNFFVDQKYFIRFWHRAKSRTSSIKTLFVVHGFGEHSQRYEHFPFYLQKDVDMIFALDLPGHGQSKGGRGHCESFSEIDRALARCFQSCHEIVAKDSKIESSFLLGHSFGGLTVLHTLLCHLQNQNHILENWKKQFNFSGTILSAPLLKVAFPIPVIKKTVGELIEPYLGWLPLKNEIRSQWVSHDSEVCAAYAKDPLNHSWITPRMFIQMNKAMTEVLEFRGEFPSPLLAIIPMDDQIVSAETNLDFMNQLLMASGFSKKIVQFDGFYHESFNEIEKERAFKVLRDWL